MHTTASPSPNPVQIGGASGSTQVPRPCVPEQSFRDGVQCAPEALGLFVTARVPGRIAWETATVRLCGRDVFDDQTAAMTLPATRWRVRQRPQVVRHTTADRAFEQFDHVIECTGRDAEFGVTTKIWGIWAFACLRTPARSSTSNTQVRVTADGILRASKPVDAPWRPSPLAHANSSERNEY